MRELRDDGAHGKCRIQGKDGQGQKKCSSIITQCRDDGADGNAEHRRRLKRGLDCVTTPDVSKSVWCTHHRWHVETTYVDRVAPRDPGKRRCMLVKPAT